MKHAFAALALCLAAPAAAAPDAAALAKIFGAREAIQGMRLSPDGNSILFLRPIPGGHGAVSVLNIATSDTRIVARDADGVTKLRWCAWKTNKRIICRQGGVADDGDVLLPYSRTAAIDIDGKNPKELGFRPNTRSYGYLTNTGTILDWLPDDPDNVLMSIYELPSTTEGTLVVREKYGVSAQRVNVFTSQRRMVEAPRPVVESLITDQQARVRLMSSVEVTNTGRMTRRLRYFYRDKAGGAWQSLFETDILANNTSWAEGFDDSGDGIYVIKPLNGRQALYLVAADGSKREQLVFAHPTVDVAGVRRIGKYGRAVAAEYYTSGLNLAFFDAGLAKLDAALAKALPGNPEVSVVDESWDGTKKLIFAGSDVDPGRYYLYNATTRQLGELLPVRPQVAGLTLAQVKSVTYPARDGTQIPAYLTLPPGKDGKNLPILILPHGGPSSRDVWGFDWLPQYFAQLGYAVLQPNFRGSAGYGDAWFRDNGFKSWPVAIGDINDGARWLAAQGIGDKSRTAILGWSYGGYAALQASITEPDLYKATIAIAPVTDLEQLKLDAIRFTNRDLVRNYVGVGPHTVAGSPAQNAARMKPPVLMFHGTKDINVFLGQAQMMDAALTRAGKPHQLVVYPELDHQLNDETARADLLLKSSEFLSANMK